MHIDMDPIKEAFVTPALEPGLDNVGSDVADIAQRMHENGMHPDEILKKILAGPLVSEQPEVE